MLAKLCFNLYKWIKLPASLSRTRICFIGTILEWKEHLTKSQVPKALLQPSCLTCPWTSHLHSLAPGLLKCYRNWLNQMICYFSLHTKINFFCNDIFVLLFILTHHIALELIVYLPHCIVSFSKAQFISYLVTCADQIWQISSLVPTPVNWNTALRRIHRLGQSSAIFSMSKGQGHNFKGAKCFQFPV